MHEHNTCGCHSSASGCSCGASHQPQNISATSEQLDFLRAFAPIAPLPIAKYIVKSSVEHSFESVALADVCLRSGEDSIACIKDTAAFLQGLEAANLIAIDYETCLEEAAYQHYASSESYQLLEDTVAQGKGREGFLGDYVTLEKGCIYMTAWGKEQLEKSNV